MLPQIRPDCLHTDIQSSIQRNRSHPWQKGSDVPLHDDVAWRKPGINPSSDHIAASVGWSVGFNDYAVGVERPQNLFSICCYPPLNIGKDQLVSICIVHRASS